jgi:hypothetical protein
MIVIGNGQSRKQIDLIKVKSKTVGCNALFRDYASDYLICVDPKILDEACSHASENTKIYTRPEYLTRNKREVFSLPQIPYEQKIRPDFDQHWGSGSYAVLLAAGLSNEIELLGFDLWSSDGLINNVYKNSPRYNLETAPAVDPSYWIYQFSRVYTVFSDKYFIVYNEKNWKMPDEWKLPNVEFKSLDSF